MALRVSGADCPAARSRRRGQRSLASCARRRTGARRGCALPRDLGFEPRFLLAWSRAASWRVRLTCRCAAWRARYSSVRADSAASLARAASCVAVLTGDSAWRAWRCAWPRSCCAAATCSWAAAGPGSRACAAVLSCPAAAWRRTSASCASACSAASAPLASASFARRCAPARRERHTAIPRGPNARLGRSATVLGQHLAPPEGGQRSMRGQGRPCRLDRAPDGLGRRPRARSAPAATSAAAGTAPPR